jgi:hypothetical protein
VSAKLLVLPGLLVAVVWPLYVELSYVPEPYVEAKKLR